MRNGYDMTNRSYRPKKEEISFYDLPLCPILMGHIRSFTLIETIPQQNRMPLIKEWGYLK